MHILERDFGIRAACMQHDCATCASMLRDAVTAAHGGPVTIPGHVFLASRVMQLLFYQAKSLLYSLSNPGDSEQRKGQPEAQSQSSAACAGGERDLISLTLH